jgi:hypothetical protein
MGIPMTRLYSLLEFRKQVRSDTESLRGGLDNETPVYLDLSVKKILKNLVLKENEVTNLVTSFMMDGDNAELTAPCSMF